MRSWSRAHLIAALALGLAATSLAWRMLNGPAPLSMRILPGHSVPGQMRIASYQTRIINDVDAVASVHSASVVVLPGQDVLGTWYGGSREGARDVVLYLSRFDHARHVWSRPVVVMDRTSLARSLGRYIKKLGNPVLAMGRNGRVWLFFVSVSAGGWSGSSINAIHSDDDGHTWSSPRRLVTSPFGNISTLVRASALVYEDGSIGLPVYHEFIGKFGEWLRIDDRGMVRDKSRISQGRMLLQPAVAALDATRLMAVMRYAGAAPYRLYRSHSDDGGLRWHMPAPTALPNRDSSAALLALDRDRLLIVYNDSLDGRNSLVLAVSSNGGQDFTPLMHIARDETGRSRYSYPGIAQAANGDVHIVYTENRKRIVHVHVSRAWIDRQVQRRERSDG